MNEVRFNHEGTLMACATPHGFRVLALEPVRDAGKPAFVRSGVAHIALLEATNIIAFVGDGSKFEFPTNKVVIWDHRAGRGIGQLKFLNEVKGVALTRSRILVVLARHVYLYRLENLTLTDHVETCDNPRGTACLSFNNVFATLGLTAGAVRVQNECGGRLVEAHTQRIACMALNADGSRLATASELGTLVRVFDCASGEKLHELRRGLTAAPVFALAFCPQSRFLACASATLHVFSLHEARANTTSHFGALKSFLPYYFSSQWSFASHALPPAANYALFFPAQGVILVAGYDGRVHRLALGEQLTLDTVAV